MKSWAWVLGLVCAMWGLPLNGTAQTAPAVTDADEDAFETVPYVGIATTPADETLGQQLALPHGIGLVVDYVDRTSPAAGVLQKGDVLHKLNDQILVNHAQFAVLVRTFKPGEEVSLTVIRAAKPVVLKVKLGEKRVRRYAAETEEQFPFRLRGPWLQTGTNMTFDFGEQPLIEAGTNGVQIRLAPQTQSGQQPGSAGTGLGLSFSVGEGGNSRSSMVVEGMRVYSLTQDAKGGKTFTAKGADGKVVFEGPVNTDAERAKVPADCRAKLDQMDGKNAQQEEPPGAPVTMPGAKTM